MGAGRHTKSTFSGTVASDALTLSATAVGPMWEGEIVGCVPTHHELHDRAAVGRLHHRPR